MPKRTNTFQKLVLALNQQLQPLGAKVEESRLLTDKTTGKSREVDVVVELRSGPHTLLLCFESYSGRRRATVEWIDEMHAKHESIGTNKLVLVSKAGFTKVAQRKAKHHGHDAMSIKHATSVDWRSIVDVVPHMGIRALVMPRIRSILLNIPMPDRTRAEAIDDFRDLLIRLPGEKPVILLEYAEKLLHSRSFNEQLKIALKPNVPTLLRGTIEVPSGTEVVDQALGTFPLRSLYVEAACQHIEKSLPIERYAFGDATKIAIGHGSVEHFPVTMSVSQELGGDAEVRVRFETSVGEQRLQIFDGRIIFE